MIWTGQLLREKAVATSSLPNPFTLDYFHGHEARMAPIAYVCKRHGLPDEVALTIMALVEPINMAHDLFPEPGGKSWLTDEDRGIRK